MKTKQILFNLVLSLLVAGLIPMSSHAGADSEWLTTSDAAALSNPGEQVMVAGMTDDMERRALFEKALTKEFSQNGVNACPSLSVMDETETPDKATLLETARKQKMDYVLISRVKNMETAYSPSPYDPGLIYSGLGGSYYGELNAEQKRYVKAHYPEWAHVQLRTVLYSTHTGDIVWTGTTETTHPAENITPQSVVRSVSDMLVKAVAGSGARSS